MGICIIKICLNQVKNKKNSFTQVLSFLFLFLCCIYLEDICKVIHKFYDAKLARVVELYNIIYTQTVNYAFYDAKLAQATGWNEKYFTSNNNQLRNGMRCTVFHLK